jgi:hypothetical protein
MSPGEGDEVTTRIGTIRGRITLEQGPLVDPAAQGVTTQGSSAPATQGVTTQQAVTPQDREAQLTAQLNAAGNQWMKPALDRELVPHNAYVQSMFARQTQSIELLVFLGAALRESEATTSFSRQSRRRFETPVGSSSASAISGLQPTSIKT